MPIHDYHCDHCGHAFSAVQSYSEGTLEICPSCGKRPRKLMATPAIVFKGGGWYKTDSRPQPKDRGDAAPAAAPAAEAKPAPASGATAAPSAPAAPKAAPVASAKGEGASS